MNAENAEQKQKEKKLKDLDDFFLFLKKRKKINMHETNAITQKEHKRTSSRVGR